MLGSGGRQRSGCSGSWSQIDSAIGMTTAGSRSSALATMSKLSTVRALSTRSRRRFGAMISEVAVLGELKASFGLQPRPPLRGDSHC